jgi:hypothetical protein
MGYSIIEISLNLILNGTYWTAKRALHRRLGEIRKRFCIDIQVA